jgi:hypothetical protein
VGIACLWDGGRTPDVETLERLPLLHEDDPRRLGGASILTESY